MKQPLHTKILTRLLGQMSRKLGSSTLALVILLALGNTSIYGQVDCNVTMACNDGVQVSLDTDCLAEIFPDMILEDPAYDNSFYTVIVMDMEGNTLPSNVMNASHIDQEFQVSITLDGCSATCWGTITIEDKLPPVIMDCNDIVLDCDADTSPGAVPGPTASDACGSVTMTSTDSIEDLPCSDPYGRIITRTYIVTDNSGNTASCEQTISLLRATLADVKFPPNYDDIENPVFNCDINIPLLPNGAPSPEFTGYPTGVECNNIQFYYTDVVFDLCGASVKVLRQWVVIDWCTGEEITDNQIIKIVDNQPPVCTSQPDFIDMIGTDPGLCTGTYEVPAPIIIFECSDWDYIVGYKLRDENGNPFENPIYDNVTLGSNGLYSISGLPQDTSWIVYTITDACGNVTQCFTEVFVEDDEAPTPVCEGYTVITLDNSGHADLYATSVDDHSTDNCEVTDMQIKRVTNNCGHPEDLTFGEKVYFCCADVGMENTVIFRVFDAAGNYNDCVVNVSVQDKLDPTITCPGDVTLSCGSDYSNLALTGGSATAEDNCNVIITHQDFPNLNDCGLGVVTRRFTATDPQGRTATCTQRIRLVDFDPFNEGDIQWPFDMTINACSAGAASPDELNSKPGITNDDCSDIAMSYDDKLFYDLEGICIKVVRTWRVIDWCDVLDPQNPIFFDHVQQISIDNSVAPVFQTGCFNRSEDAPSGECSAVVDVVVEAEDDCTPANLLEYSYTVDYDNNGSINKSGAGNNATGVYPTGTHKVVFTAIDACDNEQTCTFFVTVRDTKPPTPICYAELTWGLDEDGQAVVWASDFNLKSEDSCDSEDDLLYSFNQQGTQTSLNFDCSDLDNGVAQAIELDMYVIDTDGNYSYCSVILNLQDSEANDACTDSDGVTGQVAGRIINDHSEGIENLEVALENVDAPQNAQDVTDEEGAYIFESLGMYDHYQVQPVSADDYRNGISTLDLVMIQRHILKLNEFDSPYQLIAADINKSNSISASDLIMLRKVILGVKDNFDVNTSWRFVPSTHEFIDVESPWGFPENVVLDELYLDQMDVDFVGVKVGDVNGTATSNLKEEEATVRNTDVLILNTFDQKFKAGDEVIVNIASTEDRNIMGMQYTLNFDPSVVAYKGLAGLALPLKDYHVATNRLRNGELAVSLDIAYGVEIFEHDGLFSFSFTALQDGSIADVISITSDVIQVEAYETSGQTIGLELMVEERDDANADGFMVYQNSPNPFKEETSIAFHLPQQANVMITIYDVTGKRIYKENNSFDAGTHRWNINKQSLNASGVLYYTIKAGEYAATKKMILIQ